MDELPSTQFRKHYAKLAEPTAVTANGHDIGVWLPGDEFLKALDHAQRCRFCGVGAVVHHAPGCDDPDFLAAPTTKPNASAQAQRDELLRKINRGK